MRLARVLRRAFGEHIYSLYLKTGASEEFARAASGKKSCELDLLAFRRRVLEVCIAAEKTKEQLLAVLLKELSASCLWFCVRWFE